MCDVSCYEPAETRKGKLWHKRMIDAKRVSTCEGGGVIVQIKDLMQNDNTLLSDGCDADRRVGDSVHGCGSD